VISVFIAVLTPGPLQRRGSRSRLHQLLRQTIDLDTVQRHLVNTAHDAFEPVHISVWLTPGTSAGPLQRGR
jgi:hypothetical protein